MSISNAIHEHLSVPYNLAKIITREMYLGTDLMWLLRLINFMLENQLQTFIEHVLNSYPKTTNLRLFMTRVRYAEYIEKFSIPAKYNLSDPDLHEGVPRALQPLLNVSLGILNGEIIFVPACDDIKFQMLEIIEAVLHSAKDAIQVEGAVLPSLTLEARYIRTLPIDHPTVLRTQRRVELVLDSNLNILEQLHKELTSRFEEVLTMDNESFSPEQYVKNNTLAECRRVIGRLQLAAEHAGSYVTNSLPLFLVFVNCADLKSQLANSATRLANKLLEAYALGIRESNQAMTNEFQAMLLGIAHKPDTPEQWEDACKYLLKCEQDVSRIVKQFEQTKKTWEIFEEFSFAISPQDFKLYVNTYMYPKQVRDAIRERSFQLDHEKQALASGLRVRTTGISAELEGIRTAVDKFENYVAYDNYEEYYTAAKKIDQQLASMELLLGEVNNQRNIFGMPGADLAAQIEMIKSQFMPYLQLWTTIFSFQTASSQWMHGPFDSVDAEGVERNVGQWLAMTKRLMNALDGKPTLPVAVKLYESIEKVHDCVPLIVHLRNPGLRVRHWNSLSSSLNVELGPGVENTLSGFIEHGFVDKLTIISDINSKRTHSWLFIYSTQRYQRKQPRSTISKKC